MLVSAPLLPDDKHDLTDPSVLYITDHLLTIIDVTCPALRRLSWDISRDATLKTGSYGLHSLSLAV